MANTTHTVITTGGGDYLTLNAYEDAIDGTAYGAGETATVNCSGTTADTTAVIIDGWDTDVSIIINGDNTTGKWNTSAYRLIVSGIPFSIYDGQLTLSNLQIQHTDDVQYRATINFAFNDVANSVFRVDSCIIRGDGGTATADKKVIHGSSQATNTTYIYNTVVYDGNGFTNNSCLGINCQGGTMYVENCTVYDCDVGINRSAGTLTVINTIVNSCGNNYNGTMTTSYSISDVAAELSGTGDINSANVVFVNEGAGTEDFHLDSTDTSGAKDGGTGTVNGGYTDDIDGVTRSGTWDIGADEYVAAGGGEVTPYGYLSTNKGFW